MAGKKGLTKQTGTTRINSGGMAKVPKNPKGQPTR